jgi:excisionase family DNA binding protein
MTRQLVTLVQALGERPWTTEPFLRRLVKERRIPFHKAGGKLLFDLADLDAYAERGRVEPPAPLGIARAGRRRAG